MKIWICLEIITAWNIVEIKSTTFAKSSIRFFPVPDLISTIFSSCCYSYDESYQLFQQWIRIYTTLSQYHGPWLMDIVFGFEISSKPINNKQEIVEFVLIILKVNIIKIWFVWNFKLNCISIHLLYVGTTKMRSRSQRSKYFPNMS